jgi:SAC3 domain-containing protein 1
MVKQYCRSAAGSVDISKPSLLRPFDVLLSTVEYLLRFEQEHSIIKIVFFIRLVEENDNNWSNVYEFVSDRLRSVRQDMIIQQIDDQRSLHLLNLMIPFYINSEYR